MPRNTEAQMESSFRPMTCKNKKKLRWIVGFEGFWAWTSLPNVGGSSVKEKPFTLRTLLGGCSWVAALLGEVSHPIFSTA